MISNGSRFKVLANTRSADQVIRLTGEALPEGVGGAITTNEIYRHEWVHYFQFSAVPTGVILSQYRRNCFTILKDLLRRSENGGDFVLDPFLEQLDMFNTSWEAWPSDWYSFCAPADARIAAAHLDRTGTLRVRLADPDYTISLPLGLYAVYEAMAWCATAMTHRFQQDIPRTVDSFVYTWPLWVLADATGRDLDQVRDEERMALMPFLLFASCYDCRLMPDSAALPKSFTSMTNELNRRNVTVGRLTWQLFHDYERFWTRELNLANCDAYLAEIGLPTLSQVFEETMGVIRLSLDGYQEFFAGIPGSLPPNYTPLLPDVLAEVDLLQTSLSNLGAVLAGADRALIWPVMLERELARPVCALETPLGYRWFSIRYEDDEPAETERLDSRILLREMAAIMEHILIQLAFDSHVACYGSLDWRRPINVCPVAAQCMARPQKKGIEFCVDQAWRERIGEVVPGVFNYHGIEPPEELIPGIGAAFREYQAAIRGEAPRMERARVDVNSLGLGMYLTGLDQSSGREAVGGIT